MPDAVKKTPAVRYSIEERIGVLEELLDERYSCARSGPTRCRARPSSGY